MNFIYGLNCCLRHNSFSTALEGLICTQLSSITPTCPCSSSQAVLRAVVSVKAAGARLTCAITVRQMEGSWGPLASCLSAKAPVRYTVSVRLSPLVKQSQTVWQGVFAILVQVYKDVAHCQEASMYSNQTKRTCPTCTAYVNDNDALLACDGNPDYTITFCGLL